MIFQKTAIDGVFIVEAEKIEDNRGFFSRAYCQNEMLENTGDGWQPIQINHSGTKAKGSIRGMHYQTAPAAEVKFVRCIKGSIFDVAVDLRIGSPTFLQHVSVELTPENGKALLVPRGCAHGFQTLEDYSDIFYLNSTLYAKEYEGGIRFDDPALEINWPLAATVVSERDKAFALLKPDFKGIPYEA